MTRQYLLQNGLVVDGSGEEGYPGSVLVEGDRIQAVFRGPGPAVDCEVIDCTGKVIAPGFIDAHSHQDTLLFYENERAYTEPFIRQGITTYVAGNCGHAVAGLERGSPYWDKLVEDPNNRDPRARMLFPTFEEYFSHMQSYGMRQNMACLAAHGITAGSVLGMEKPERITQDHKRRIRYLLDEALDSGCKGISFGLGYRPDNFFSDEEVREASEAAIRRNKVITVHERVMSLNRPYTAGEEPENVRWTREFIELYRDSGAKLQMSHLLFVGRTAWPTYEPMMEMFDREVRENGTDLWFDMYSYTQGFSSIQILCPQIFFAPPAGLYEDKETMAKIAEGMNASFRAVGILPADVQLCNGMVAEYAPYCGMFMDRIMEARGMNVAELYFDLYRKTNGFARIYFYVEQEERTIPDQMVHPRALYMTDARYFEGCHQIQTAYNSMPKFLRLTRETGCQPLETTIAKMTGRTADRFDLRGRGYLREGCYADIVVFDYERIQDTSTPDRPDAEPVGIEHVFVNGSHILSRGQLDADSRSGMILT